MYLQRALDWLLRRFGFRLSKVVKSVSAVSASISK